MFVEKLKLMWKNFCFRAVHLTRKCWQQWKTLANDQSFSLCQIQRQTLNALPRYATMWRISNVVWKTNITASVQSDRRQSYFREWFAIRSSHTGWRPRVGARPRQQHVSSNISLSCFSFVDLLCNAGTSFLDSVSAHRWPVPNTSPTAWWWRVCAPWRTLSTTSSWRKVCCIRRCLMCAKCRVALLSMWWIAPSKKVFSWIGVLFVFEII